jgi:hypothetical protein
VVSASEPPTPPLPESRVKISGFFDVGITVNPGTPQDNQNFGRLFDDRANEPLLNQVGVDVERALVPQAVQFDWGFKVQFMVGSDARFTHSLGRFDRTSNATIQPDLTEAYLNLQFPFTSETGLNLKIGKFATLEGVETVDPRPNFFYSHSYMFNFGVPGTHTGLLGTFHLANWFDLYAGITRGVSTSVDDNNDRPAFHGGIGFSLLDGQLTALASTHIGAETPGDNEHKRYLNDLTITAKLSKNLTSITELNYDYDAAADATGYGIAQYFTYSINDLFSVGVRAEIWRDADAFYVASFADNDDALDGLRGGAVTLDPRTVSGGRTTYGAVTLGLNIKPPMAKPVASLVIRPELRFDRALNGTHPFNDSSDRDQFTAGLDVIVSF